MVFHVHAGVASPSWWVIDNGTATLGSSQGEFSTRVSSSRSQVTVPFFNMGLGCVSSSGHRSPAPAAFACAQAQDQARVPLRDGG